MISVAAARQQIAYFHRPLGIRKVGLSESFGKVLAADFYAPFPLPHFPQSSVDGYAVAFGEKGINEYELLAGESSAGSPSHIHLQPGQALRIFTGAAVPAGADAVIMQEKIIKENKKIFVKHTDPEIGMNIRATGSDLQLHELAIPKGSRIHPATIGLLASMGIQEVNVFKAPVVSIIITGNEFMEPGETLKNGYIYESNSWMLEAALRQSGIEQIKIKKIKDDPNLIYEALHESLPQSDIVIITGGVSVGDYDYTVAAATKAGVQQIFHKIAQKPGKPMYFGMKEEVFVFGLPGNMSSVLTCFYIYLSPLLAALQQLPNPVITTTAKLAESTKSPQGLTSFWKGFYKQGLVHPLVGQESYKLKSFAAANCLIEIPENITSVEKDTIVNIHLLPNC
ncbi:MAG: molybdopterin molybdotransferase MoeA [Bacteroidetes bacterium]|nr:molybdopterin molybdotransferase MoeA [Bacteroidota bacterium]